MSKPKLKPDPSERKDWPDEAEGYQRDVWRYGPMPEWATLAEMASRMRRVAELGDHEALSSLSRIVASLGEYVRTCRPTAEEMLELESLVGGHVLEHGRLRPDSVSARRLRRPRRLGSPRAKLSDDLVAVVEWRQRELSESGAADGVATGDVAKHLARIIGQEWPATLQLRLLSPKQIETRIRNAIEHRGLSIMGKPDKKPSDAEVIVKAALRGVGFVELGVTESEIKGLFDYRNKRSQRGQPPG